MRLRKKPWIKDQIVTYDEWVVLQPERYRGNWCDWFHNDNPIFIELGTGKGQFITALAQKYPLINFLGIEKREEVLISAVKKASTLKLRNIAFVWIDIDQIGSVFGESEISRIYLNFSDPWPKSGHAKRRLTHRNFLQQYKNLLSTGNEIHLKTDNEKLFEFSLNELSDSGFFLKNITFDLHHSGFTEAMSVMTEYEQKFVDLGMKIFRVEASLR